MKGPLVLIFLVIFLVLVNSFFLFYTIGDFGDSSEEIKSSSIKLIDEEQNVERIDYSNIMPWETGTSEEIEDEIDLFFGRYDTNTKRKSSSGGSSGSKSDGSDLSKEGEGLDSNEEEQRVW